MWLNQTQYEFHPEQAVLAVAAGRRLARAQRRLADGRARVYGFDTGFVCHHRGWHQLRREDCGPLWEHMVLNELHAYYGRAPVHYWRTKHGNEIDFVLARRGHPPTAIECKWTADSFDPAGHKAFRNRYPDGDNIVVAHDIGRAFTKRFGELAVRFVGLDAIGTLAVK